MFSALSLGVCVVVSHVSMKVKLAVPDAASRKHLRYMARMLLALPPIRLNALLLVARLLVCCTYENEMCPKKRKRGATPAGYLYGCVHEPQAFCARTAPPRE